jgi:hypothetical protein
MKMNKVLQFSLLLCVILTASAFAAESSAPTYSDNFKYDVVRGSTNIVAAPYEIYTTTKEHHLNKGPEQNKGITRGIAGFVDGTFRMITRTGSGIWDHVIAAIPGAQEGYPVEPELLYDPDGITQRNGTQEKSSLIP